MSSLLKTRVVPSLAARDVAFCHPLVFTTSSQRVARASGQSSAFPLRSAVSGVSSRRPFTCLAVAASAGDVSDGKMPFRRARLRSRHMSRRFEGDSKSKPSAVCPSPSMLKLPSY